MKLHFHPVSTTSRPVVLFLEEHKIKYEPVVVDLMSGAHLKEPYNKLNPNSQVPCLEDGDFVLCESSAILKYLAEKYESPTYPKDIKQRARINERMDWFNSNHYREWGYHLIYPQIFPHHLRNPEPVQKATLEWGREKSEHWLTKLDQHVIGNHKYLCGDTLTIADYFGAVLIHAGSLIGVSLKRWPNVDRWMSTMKALPTWGKVNEAADGFAASLKGKQFVTIS